MTASNAPGVHASIDAVWRLEAARIIAGLARMVHDIGLAEELAQDALVAALEQWPESGVPDNPGAWLMAVGKRRAIDRIPVKQRLEHKLEEIGRDLEGQAPPELDVPDDEQIEDDVLRLIFTACHPVLSVQARVALTLRMLGGLTTDEIAHASSSPSRRWRSGSSGRNALSRTPAYRSRSPPDRTVPLGCRPSWRSST